MGALLWKWCSRHCYESRNRKIHLSIAGIKVRYRVTLFFVLMMDNNQMPHMTGAQACKMMREMGFTGIIIGLTGNVFEQEIADYIAQGANAVLSKPLVLLENLFETLRQISAANKV